MKFIKNYIKTKFTGIEVVPFFIRRKLSRSNTSFWWLYNSTSRKIIKKRFNFFLTRYFFLYPFIFFIYFLIFYLFFNFFFFFNFFCFDYYFFFFCVFFVSFFFWYFVFFFFSFFYFIYLFICYLFFFFIYLFFSLRNLFFNFIIYWYFTSFFYTIFTFIFFYFYLFYFYIILQIFIYFFILFFKFLFFFKLFLFFFFSFFFYFYKILKKYFNFFKKLYSDIKENSVKKNNNLMLFWKFFKSLYLINLRNFLNWEEFYSDTVKHRWFRVQRRYKRSWKDTIYIYIFFFFNFFVKTVDIDYWNELESDFLKNFTYITTLNINKSKKVEEKEVVNIYDLRLIDRQMLVMIENFYNYNWDYIDYKYDNKLYNRFLWKYRLYSLFFFFETNWFNWLKNFFINRFYDFLVICDLFFFKNEKDKKYYTVTFSVWGWEPVYVTVFDLKKWTQEYTYNYARYNISFFDINGFFFFIYINFLHKTWVPFSQIIHFYYWTIYFYLLKNAVYPTKTKWEKNFFYYFWWFKSFFWTDSINMRRRYLFKVFNFFYNFIFLDVIDFFFNLKNFFFFFKNIRFFFLYIFLKLKKVFLKIFFLYSLIKFVFFFMFFFKKFFYKIFYKVYNLFFNIYLYLLKLIYFLFYWDKNFFFFKLNWNLLKNKKFFFFFKKKEGFFFKNFIFLKFFINIYNFFIYLKVLFFLLFYFFFTFSWNNFYKKEKNYVNLKTFYYFDINVYYINIILLKFWNFFIKREKLNKCKNILKKKQKKEIKILSEFNQYEIKFLKNLIKYPINFLKGRKVFFSLPWYRRVTASFGFVSDLKKLNQKEKPLKKKKNEVMFFLKKNEKKYLRKQKQILNLILKKKN